MVTQSLHDLSLPTEQVKVLSGHTSLVKGVTWDPIGKYLASQSDDRSIIIWRTSDWQQERTITKPFLESGGTTHVLRLGWSPDGSYMVSVTQASLTLTLRLASLCNSDTGAQCQHVLDLGVGTRHEQHGTDSSDHHPFHLEY